MMIPWAPNHFEIAKLYLCSSCWWGF